MRHCALRSLFGIEYSKLNSLRSLSKTMGASGSFAARSMGPHVQGMSVTDAKVGFGILPVFDMFAADQFEGAQSSVSHCQAGHFGAAIARLPSEPACRTELLPSG